MNIVAITGFPVSRYVDFLDEINNFIRKLLLPTPIEIYNNCYRFELYYDFTNIFKL